MKSPFRRAASVLCLTCIISIPAVAEEHGTGHFHGWVNTLSDGTAVPPVTRTTDAYPLSDQENKGTWVRLEALSDEFKGNQLDVNKWWPTNAEWRGRQPGYFSSANVKVSDGKLQLTIKREEPPAEAKAAGYHTYTTAAVQSKATVKYGYFEVKAKPSKSAVDSAFFFYPSTCASPLPWTPATRWRCKQWPEIDVFEIGGGAPGFERRLFMQVGYHNLITEDPWKEELWFQQGDWLAPADLADDYHTYGLEWDEQEIRFYFDGVLVRKGPNTHWHQPCTLNFDIETAPKWFGLPKDTDLPSTYSIEYVRAWQKRN